MSRVNIQGEKYELAFGVDHATGAFVQLWVKPTDDKDCAAVVIDSKYGVNVDKYQIPQLSTEILRYVEQVNARIESAGVAQKVRQVNIDERVVIDLARIAGGFPDITRDVYQIFD